LEPGSIEVQVHKLATSAGGTRHINEIDGFLQVTTEVLNRATAQLLRHDPTQAKILDAFTEEVTIRLIEMTDAWDSHSVLVAAVKRAQKRKNTLRRELLAIRKERADIQREMEAVRQSHELGEQEMRDLKIQQDFIADMEDLKARAPNPAEEEDQIKVHDFEGYSNNRMASKLPCWSYGRWWQVNPESQNDWLHSTDFWSNSTMH
jgi:IS1 family transposase